MTAPTLSPTCSVKPCFGDSGGPVFLDGYLVGVTSWGTSQFCTAGQAGYQRLDTQDALEFYGPFLGD